MKSPTQSQILSELRTEFGDRKFVAGLLIAFIDFYAELGVPGKNLKDLDAFFRAFPKQDRTATNKKANTLIVAIGEKRLSLRKFYNEAERVFRVDNHRFDFPSCAPHATQAWGDYTRWLEALLHLSGSELAALKQEIVTFVIGRLPDHSQLQPIIGPAPRLFEAVLDQFDFKSQNGEPTGAAFQGTVFGFLRADNPHLQIEIDKVRVGSKRLQRVGDIDAWEGARLALSSEVKQYTLKAAEIVDEFSAFATAVRTRGAIGIVAALKIDGDCRDGLKKLALKSIDLDSMRSIVELWDPVKQRIAVTSLLYYVSHVEKNSALQTRLDKFLEEAGVIEPV